MVVFLLSLLLLLFFPTPFLAVQYSLVFDPTLQPQVNCRDEVDAALKACLYPPEGVRGVGVGRASGYGAKVPEMLSNSNKELVIVCQIETAEAVANIQDMVQVDRVDAFFVGPFDLSGSLGHLGVMFCPLAALLTTNC